MGLRRDIAREAGGFRTDLGWGAAWMPGEETDLMLRLWRRGGRLRYVPDAVVDHHILESRVTWDYYQHWQRGLGRALVRMSPPRSRLERWRQVVTSTWKIAHWQLRARGGRAGGVRSGEAECAAPPGGRAVGPTVGVMIDKI